MSFAAASSATDHNPDAVVAGMLAVLRALAAAFIAAFGDPAALIKGGAIYGKTRERMLRWLHDMECVVRRLLLLRAALFPTPAARGARAGGAKGRTGFAKEGAAITLFGPSEDPAQWRVAFRMPTPPEPLWMLGGFRGHEDVSDLGDGAGAPQKDSAASLKSIGYHWVDDPRPLAERFEALRRVIEDHEHYAARLAQRLYGWRGRDERRQLFLTSLCAVAPIANEAGLPDEDWAAFADGRIMAGALLPVFRAQLTPARPPAAAPPACSLESRPETTTPPPKSDAGAALKNLQTAARQPSVSDAEFDALVADIQAQLQAIADTS